MIFLYTALLLLVGVAHFLIKRRVAALEKKYARIVKDADDLLRQSNYRDGNSNRQDPYQSAKRQYQLALLAQKRDRMETSYSRWHRRAERLGKLRHRLRSWKGRKLPYLVGGLDTLLLLGALDYLGYREQLTAQAVIDFVSSLVKHA